MVVGLCEFVVHVRGARSLKDKRHVVRKVIDRIRHHYRISISEVGYQGEHQRSKLGLAIVSNDSKHVESLLDRILADCGEVAVCQDVKREVLHWTGDPLEGGEWSFDTYDPGF